MKKLIVAILFLNILAACENKNKETNLNDSTNTPGKNLENSNDKMVEDVKSTIKLFSTWFETENQYFMDEVHRIEKETKVDIVTYESEDFLRVKDSIVSRAMHSIETCTLLDKKLKEEICTSDKTLKYSLGTILTGDLFFYSLSGFDLLSINIEDIKDKSQVTASINGNIDGPEGGGFEKMTLYLTKDRNGNWLISKIETK